MSSANAERPPVWRFNAGVVSHCEKQWDGIRAERVRRGATGPDYLRVCLPRHAIFYIHSQRPVPVARRHNGERMRLGSASGRNINFLAANTDMVTEHLNGCPASEYLALFFEPGELSKLASDTFDPSTVSLESAMLTDDAMLQQLLPALSAETARPGPVNRLIVDSLMILILKQLVDQRPGSARTAVRTKGGLAPYQLKRLMEAMCDQIATNLSLADLSALVGLSPHHLCRAFKESTGVPPHLWQVQQRVRQAKSMMTATDLPLAVIATELGFTDQSHFTTVFRRLVGVTPHAWRLSQRD